MGSEKKMTENGEWDGLKVDVEPLLGTETKWYLRRSREHSKNLEYTTQTVNLFVGFMPDYGVKSMQETVVQECL
jgi:hypothetical protein